MRRVDGNGSVMIAEPGKLPREVIAGVVSNSQYVDPGFLVFARDGTLLAQRFDATTAVAAGEPAAIAEPVRYFYSTGATTFATSHKGGVLVYQSHAESGRLAWLDRSGRELGVIGDPAATSASGFRPTAAA